MCSVNEFLDKAESMTEGFLFAMFTDEIWLEEWPSSEEKKKEFCNKGDLLLEARIFNTAMEMKLFRGDIGKRNFRMRIRDDSKEYFKEEQYLDIDTVCSEKIFREGKQVKATGGGVYHLPLSDYNDIKIKIHNYIDYYEETGQAYVSDWRLVEFFQESEEESNGKRT